MFVYYLITIAFYLLLTTQTKNKSVYADLFLLPFCHQWVNYIKLQNTTVINIFYLLCRLAIALIASFASIINVVREYGLAIKKH